MTVAASTLWARARVLVFTNRGANRHFHGGSVELIHKTCAGLDVHKDTVVACIRLASNKKVRREVQTFSTTTAGLLRLGDWLAEHGVEHAVMESTGVYWKPIWHVVGSFVDLSLANANEVRNLPGRKSDVSDAQWLADLSAHGLLRRSFVPEKTDRAATRSDANPESSSYGRWLNTHSVSTKCYRAPTSRCGRYSPKC